MTAERSILKSKPVFLFLAAFLIAAIVLGLRFPDRIFDPQFRDEDGFIFFRQSALGGLRTFTLPYAGYLHTLQRTIAWIGGLVHPLWAPWVYNWASFLITAAVCGRIAVAGIPAGWRLGFGALFLLQPFGLWNAIHLTNLFWFTAALFPLFAIERAPVSRLGKAGTIATAAFLGLTGPFSAFFAPLFVLRALLLDRSRYTFALGGTVIATGAVQAAVLLSSPRFDTTTETDSFPLFGIWTLANRFFVNLSFVRFADETSALQSVIAFALAGLFAAGTIYAMRRSIDRDDRMRIALLFTGAALMYVAGIFGTLGPWLKVVPGGENSRYYILPCMLLGWAVVAITCAPGRRWMRAPAAALLLAAPLTVFRTTPFPPSPWAGDLRRVQREGYGMVRLHPAGSHRHLFMARGEGRYGFLRGKELARLHDPNVLLRRAFGLRHAASASMDAPSYVFLHNLGNREGVITFPRSLIGIVVPNDAEFFAGSYGFAPLAIPPDSVDGMAGGDGILFRIWITDGASESRTLLTEYIPSAYPRNPASRRQFRVEIPPGSWKALFIDNLAGATDDHVRYDFALWTDLAFLKRQADPPE